MESDLARGLTTVAVPTPAEAAPPQPAAHRVAAWFARALAADGAADYRRAFWVFAGLLVTVVALAVAQGPCLQLYYGHDDIGFLAAAWRVRNGLFPHADYHTALGALNPWIYAAGMWVFGPTASVLPLCNSLVAAALGFLAWTVAARRLPAWLAAAFAGTQFVVAMTPHLLRYEWFAATYDGYYNRQCYALVSTLMLLLFLPRRRNAGGRAARRDDGLAGAILGWLLFVKISYFMAGVGLLGLAFLLVRREWRRLPWETFLAFSVVFALCLPLIRFDLAAMLADLRLAAAARPASPSAVFTAGGYLDRVSEAWIETVALAGLQFSLRPPWWFRRAAGEHAAQAAPSWAEFAGIVVGSGFLCMTNSPGGTHSETPLLTSWLFVLLGCQVRAPAVASAQNRQSATLPQRHFAHACLLASFLWAYTFGNGLACLCWAVSPVRTSWQQLAWQRSPAFDSPSLAPLQIYATGGESARIRYADKVNDGLRLLRALGGTHRVEALDFVNPFPFALQWPVARDGLWCWHIGFSFGPAAHPSAEEVFGEIDVVMVPKHPGEERSCAALRTVFGPYLGAHYRQVNESDYWYVLRRL